MWIWCPRCERCYLIEESRKVNGQRLCSYPDCGNRVSNAWAWEMLRRLIPNYPVTPARFVRYSLAG